MTMYKVYKIVNDRDCEIYVGCTKSSLNQRWSCHKAAMKQHPDQKIYKYMADIGVKYFRIELIETRECETKIAARKFEQHWIDRLESTLNTYGAVPNVECEHCGKRFRDKSILTKHIRTHTGERPFECEHCGKRFAEKGTLRDHIRTHTGERPFGCEHCGKRFTLKHHLTRHIRTHTILDH